MSDLISRQQAIDALHMHLMYRMGTDSNKKRLDEWINNLPPAEPKRGKWIIDRSGAYCCSECMEPCATYVMMKPRDKFCKICGIRNEVTE